MRAWFFLLGGMTVWAVHFMGAYAIASIADVAAEADAPAARWSVGAFTLACLAADGLILAAVVRGLRRATGDGLDQWILSVGGLGAALSLLAVFWQGLPALVGH